MVSSDGLSAVFTGIASLSTVVGLIPEVLSVAIDIKPDSTENTVNLNARGVLPVAILSSESFDARTVRAETVTLAGAPAQTVGRGRLAMSILPPARRSRHACAH